jgi:hypothetical protein
LPFIAVADSEEVSQRNVNAGSFLAVVINAEADEARPGVLIIGYREPDVTDNAWARKVGHHESFAGHDPLAVVVASDERVVARGSMSTVGL